VRERECERRESELKSDETHLTLREETEKITLFTVSQVPVIPYGKDMFERR
jgi:hypothetical protein